MKAIPPKDVDSYIAEFTPEIQAILQQVRATIKAAAPEAEETISYGMPAFTQHGHLVYFAAAKKHIGLYATPSGNLAFQKELEGYVTGKGSIQFPLDKPMPLELISTMVKFRVIENMEKAAAKKSTRKKATPKK